MINPKTRESLFEYARALAEQETRRQWREFEDLVFKTRGQAEGKLLLDRINSLRTSVEKQGWYRELPEGKLTKHAEDLS